MAPVPGAGSDIFLDANIFLHIILENPSHADNCAALVKHIEAGHYRGISSIIVLSEVFHRTFIADVAASCRIEPASAPAYIKRHAGLFQKLPRAYESISAIKQMHNIRISDIFFGHTGSCTCNLAEIFSFIERCSPHRCYAGAGD
ncbi:MAG: hypothetical protein WC406_03245 [Methanoregula sp.]